MKPTQLLKRADFPGFPNVRPDVPFLSRSLPSTWKSPWADRDIWRYHPMFSKRSRIMRLAPGLSIGIILFGFYYVYDEWNCKEGEKGKELKRLEKYMKERDHH